MNQYEGAPIHSLALKTLYSALAGLSSIWLFLFGVLLARSLGPDQYGVFTFTLAYCGVFFLIVDAGFTSLSTREISRDREVGRDIFDRGLGLQLAITPLVVALAVGVLIVSPVEATTVEVVLWLSLAWFSRVIKYSFRGVLRGYERFDIEALSMTLERVALLLLGLYVYIRGESLDFAIMGFAAIKVIDCLLLALLIHVLIVPVSPRFELRKVPELVRQLAPFAVIVAIWAIYNYTDTIMLGFFRDLSEVGKYGAIYQLFEGMLVIPVAISGVYLPMMSKQFVTERGSIRSAFVQGERILLLASVPVVATVLVCSADILHILFGEAYKDSASGMLMLLIGAPFVFLYWFYKNALIATNQTGVLVKIGLAGVTFNIVFNFIAIPAYGLLGACVATLGAEFLTFLCAKIQLLPHSDKEHPYRSWLLCAVACVIFCVPLWAAEWAFGTGLWGIPVSMVVCYTFLCLSRYWKANELNYLSRIGLPTFSRA